jgi:CheY-like chemotaxis protein/DNA-binding XRE family transcriptional regulator
MPTELQARLAAAIKAQRRRLGVTQEELAWRANLHRTYVADIERGGRNITLRSIANLARALEMSVEHLLAPTPGSVSGFGDPKLGMGEILLVEDDANDAELALRAFKRASFQNPIKWVSTGREALDYLFCRGRYAYHPPVGPHMVLLDLNLPDIDGQSVLKQIKAKQKTKTLPVVVLTMSRDDKNILECSRLGAANYIIKPLDFESFSKVTPKLNLCWALVGPPARKSPRSVS